ncbi:probable purine permease 10 [Coffea eugenioides]|uniref:probable purine permease 10 n=1 Tax=Coffea eugenioides TaxID=49369 RepID=UPI000F60F535|nr:probable purine permease 10 [Coffea eugenioides]
MEEAQEQSSIIKGSEAKEMMSPGIFQGDLQSDAPCLRQYTWWLQVAIYTILTLAGQTVGVLLGRLYFDKGGNSEWMATLVQNIGFPVLLPFLLSSPSKTRNQETGIVRPSFVVLASTYTFLGLCLAGESLLYSLGLKYLPVSTFSLINTSQLAFNALFAYFLNSQKLTPFIINSLVLLTLSSVVLVIQDDSEDSNKTSNNKYTAGVICTIAASALYSFMLSATQLIIQKILKKETFRLIIDLTIYKSLVATVAITIGIFVSGQWKSLKSEMEEFKLGKVSYIMTLLWTAVSWQVFDLGCNGLIFKVSSLFSNVISVVGLPVAPVLAVVFFHDKVTGAKVLSLLLALWGFTSYVYQQYLDDMKAKADRNSTSNEVVEASSVGIK